MENNNLSISTLKNSARDQAKAVRQKIHGGASPLHYINLSKNLLSHLNTLNCKNKIVAGFWPLGSEVDVRIALSDLLRNGHATCLPAIEKKDQPLVFRQYDVGDELHTGLFGTKEPSVDAPHVTPDILLVPLLAFDESGHRLGYGGGYYDRTIEMLSKEKTLLTIGLAFSEQKVRNVPHTDHDIMLDYIVTELGLLGGKKQK